MEFERDQDISKPVEPQKLDAAGFPPPGPVQGSAASPEPRKRGSGWRILLGILLFFSVVANVGLFLVLIGMMFVFSATGSRPGLNEAIVREGPSSSKIAVINVQGVIEGNLAADVERQLKAAAKDRRVKALILRVNSPGGTISGSDGIYNAVKRFQRENNKPMIAFMQGVAASGGYYASVACEKIMAEPTTITGSIGVISWWLVVQELLENKLGVVPVTVKSGLKKDWPSSFRAPTEEELAYMDERLIQPAFERFLEVVVKGRASVLGPDEVKRLADGGIYSAAEALKEKLIDDIGYLDDAVESIKTMAGIKKARVIEYRKPFTLADVLTYGKSSQLKLDKSTIYEMSSPKVLYLWTAY